MRYVVSVMIECAVPPDSAVNLPILYVAAGAGFDRRTRIFTFWCCANTNL